MAHPDPRMLLSAQKKGAIKPQEDRKEAWLYINKRGKAVCKGHKGSTLPQDFACRGRLCMCEGGGISEYPYFTQFCCKLKLFGKISFI